MKKSLIYLEALDDAADMHARHFSSPISGAIEDAVTGTTVYVTAFKMWRKLMRCEHASR